MNTFGERLKKAREGMNMSQGDLAIAIGIKPASGVISNWERDLNKPDAEKIVKLCEVLHISVSYLLNYYMKSEFDMSMQEQELIKKYRQLDVYGKKVVDQIIEIEYDRIMLQTLQIKDNAVCNTSYITKTEYKTGLSAGTGLFVFDDIPTHLVQVPAIYHYIDFVISVTGDSMEPTYKDGDKVMVVKQDTIHKGEIGVFMINGNGYIKELGNGCLISHNKIYPMIEINEYTICIGKVIGKLDI